MRKDVPGLTPAYLVPAFPLLHLDKQPHLFLPVMSLKFYIVHISEQA